VCELVTQLLKHGSEPEMPFSPIVRSGPNSANPHASPSDRKLQAGDLLVVDWGAAYDGYISDLTRTFAVGDVDAEYQKIHKIVYFITDPELKEMKARVEDAMHATKAAVEEGIVPGGSLGFNKKKERLSAAPFFLYNGAGC
jgi:Xaa-Pro aminopeptidase